MTNTQKLILAVNVVGGCAVLGSYAWGIHNNSNAAVKLWGGVPQSIRPLYTGFMFLAAVGFLAVLYALLFKASTALQQSSNQALILSSFILILLPSSLWMSLTFSYASDPSTWRWVVVRGVLLMVALGSVALIATVIRIRPVGGGLPWNLAIAGSVAFAFHTTVLDALLWPVLYRQ